MDFVAAASYNGMKPSNIATGSTLWLSPHLVVIFTSDLLTCLETIAWFGDNAQMLIFLYIMQLELIPVECRI